MNRPISPLRYPGGKGILAGFVRLLVAKNDLFDGEYAEPYCGGAAVALDLLKSGLVHRIRLNDVDPAIYSFWWSVFNAPEEICRRIASVRISVPTWRRQRNVLRNIDDHDSVDIGFATLFLNRTNRSGILNAGPIGGLEQTGDWKLDARFNRLSLCRLIEDLAAYGPRVHVTNLDAVKFVQKMGKILPKNSLIYLDPPYVVKGQRLYRNSYTHEDHRSVAESVKALQSCHWIVSYDDVELVRALYAEQRAVRYGIGYSANNRLTGKEIMFFSKNLIIPEVKSPVRVPADAWLRQERGQVRMALT